MMEVFDNVPLASRITFILLFYYVMWSIFIAILTMWFRYLAVSLFALLFPFTLFLYFFDWTRTMGRKLLRNTLVWAFAPVIGAVWLAVGVAMMQSAAVGASSITGPLMAPLFMMVCMLMIAIAPLVMSEVMKWLGGIISSVGMLVPGPYGIVMVGAGGIMQGQSPAALMAMGLKAGVGSIFKGMRMGAGKAGMPSLAGAGGEAKTPTRADRKKDWKRDRRALDKAREKGRISDKGYRGAKGRIDQKYGMTPGGRFLRQMGTPGGVLGTMGMAGKGAASTLGSKLGKTRAGKALSSSKIGRGAARIGSGAARLRGRAGKWGRDKAKALAGTGPARWAAEKGRWAGRSAAKLAFNPVGAARDLGRQARAKATGQTLPKREAAGRGRELADEKKFRETRLKGQMAYGGRRSRPEDTMEQRMDLM